MKDQKKEFKEEISDLNKELDNALYEEGIMPRSPLYQWSKVIQKYILTHSSLVLEESEDRRKQTDAMDKVAKAFVNQIASAQNKIESIRLISQEKSDLAVNDLVKRISSSMEKQASNIIKEKLPIYEARFYKTIRIQTISKIMITIIVILLLGFFAGYMYDKQAHDFIRYCNSHITIDTRTGVKWCPLEEK